MVLPPRRVARQPTPPLLLPRRRRLRISKARRGAMARGAKAGSQSDGARRSSSRRDRTRQRCARGGTRMSAMRSRCTNAAAPSLPTFTPHLHMTHPHHPDPINRHQDYGRTSHPHQVGERWGAVSSIDCAIWTVKWLDDSGTRETAKQLSCRHGASLTWLCRLRGVAILGRAPPVLF